MMVEVPACPGAAVSCCFLGCVDAGWLKKSVGLSEGLGTPLVKLW